MRVRRSAAAQVTMIRAAYWTCAVLALAHARLYERCELARDLRSLGVPAEDISTWVCITFHESRFDTAAHNGYSGDHGLFQISELYWCGPGKACGLPCSALRDEDISNDLECALKIREEHNRLQGDGFLAWVVYPQHCKHNTKKYIVDCDGQLKNATVRTPIKSRSFSNPYITNNTFELLPDIDNLKPPYLTVNSIVRGGYAKMLEDNVQKSTPYNWVNYKIDNIDELTVPENNKDFPRFFQTTTTAVPTPSTTTTTTTAYPPIKVWRRIETNQFRKKQVVEKKPTPTKWLELGKPTPNHDVSSAFMDNNSKFTAAPTTSVRPTTEVTAPPITTPKPTTRSAVSFTFKTPTITEITTNKPIVFTTTTPKPSATIITTQSPIFTTKDYKPFSYSTTIPTTRASVYRATERAITRNAITTNRIADSTTRKPITDVTKEDNGFKRVSFGLAYAPKSTSNFVSPTSTINPFFSATERTTRTPLKYFPSTFTTAKTSFSSIDNKPRSTFHFFPSTSTIRPTFSTTSRTTVRPNFSLAATTTLRPIFTSTPTTTLKPAFSTAWRTTARPTISTSRRTTVRPSLSTTSTTTLRPTFSTASTTTVRSTFTTPSTTTSRPTFSTSWRTTVRPTISNAPTKTFRPILSTASTTTVRPAFSTARSTFKYSPPATTARPFFSTIDSKPKTTFKFRSPTTTIRPSTLNLFTSSKTTSPGFTFASPNAIPDPFKFSRSSRTSRLLSQRDASTAAWNRHPLPTDKPFTAQLPQSTSSSFRGITTQSTPTAKTSQSVFDLYLNPTQWPKLPTYRFPELSNSAFKLKIFSEGTTSAPVRKRT